MIPGLALLGTMVPWRSGGIGGPSLQNRRTIRRKRVRGVKRGVNFFI